MKKLSMIFFFLIFSTGPIACAQKPIGDKSITAGDLAAQIAAGTAPLILDVRSQKEFADGHIPGAINIPHTELEERIAELDGRKNDTLVLHCRSGRRAVSADEVLRQNGFTEIVELEGHMLDWRAGNHPVE